MKEILKNLVETMTLPEDSYLEQDAEIFEFFVEEIEEIFVELDALFDIWLNDIHDKDALIVIRRYFHTLKGSGRMVGAVSAGEMAWVVEDTLNRVMAGTLELTPTLQRYARATFNVYQYKLYPVFKAFSAIDIDLRPMVLLGQQLQQEINPEPALFELLNLAETLNSSDVCCGLEASTADEMMTADEPDAIIEVVEDIRSVSTFESESEPVIEAESVIEAKPPVDALEPLDLKPIEVLETVEETATFTVTETALEIDPVVEEQVVSLNNSIDFESVEIEKPLTTRPFVPKEVIIQHFVTEQKTKEELWEHIEKVVESTSSAATPESILEAAISQVEADDLEETIAIFVEEAEEHLEKIKYFLKQRPELQNYNILLRALHTLRGSSSMAQIEPMFEASSKVEKLFKSLVQEDIASTSNETTLLNQYANFVEQYLKGLRQGRKYDLALENQFNQAWQDYQAFAPESEILPAQGLISQLMELGIDLLLDTEFDFFRRATREYPEYLEELIEQAKCLSEHTNNRAAVGIHEYAAGLEHAYQYVLDQPALLNLENAEELFQFAHQEFIHLFDTLATGERVKLTENHQEILTDLYSFVDQDVDLDEQKKEASHLVTESVEPLENAYVDIGQLARRVQSDQKLIETNQAHQDFDSDLIDIFLEEAEELLEGIDQDLNTWSNDQQNLSALQNLMRYLHTLKGGANMVQATYIGTLAHELETIYERLINQQQRVSQAFIQIIRLVQDNVSDRIQLMKEQQIDYPVTQAVDILRNINQLSQGQYVETVIETPEIQPVISIEHPPVVVDEPIAPLESVKEDVVVEAMPWVAEPTVVAPKVTEIKAAPTFVIDETKTKLAQEGVSSVVTESFLEEARELLDTCEQLLPQWFEQRGNRSLLLQLQRVMHSLKGGARILELDPIAEISYELENTFEQFAVHQFNSNAYDGLLQTTLTWLNHAIFDKNYENYEKIRARLQSVEYVDVSAQLPTNVTQIDLLDGQTSFMVGDGAEPPSMLGEWGDAQHAESNNEMIRISADLVEKMIDLSGENSINRSRIEMDLGRLGNTINEMELTIQRLADQLRRMEGELETQILARHGSDNTIYEDFDPLEMDQYSSLNQLSKSLSESASDLLDFKSTLADKIRDTESLLLQQSRIQSEIQESLMRTRLVPFTGLLPRLQRIVRQTSSTLNRPTELIVKNTEGELDRTILERLVTPFEHMLRNAIDHGIEGPEERAALGKPATGQIELNISRQGTDVVVSFNDDGRGIDAQKIKAKALALGLIKPTQALTAQEIMQLIFHPGFSTAKKVTQISGRGVGLDIVQSEIKILGGHISVESTFGKGTTFTIRVPTTVAISDALMVKVGDQQFALPLAQIDRIVRLTPATLEEYFQSESDFFTIDHHQYKLRYLSEFIYQQPIPKLQNVAHSLPVLLIKSATGQTIALLVDQLIGSRAQIVVKTIGQQFAKLGAIAGATILGDGQVCLILDGQNIARQIQVTQRDKDSSKQRDMYSTSAERKLIMIVDDSVTVRKVTTRLLERHGYEVITAKDGLDAVEQLENVKPDLMLLDIEMPRMDGFEVTNLVRHHDVHQYLPIIMITSRTGEKHRERAFGLGVSDYMGKPFQEAELLHNIEKHLAVFRG